jgi:hypothetical protein
MPDVFHSMAKHDHSFGFALLVVQAVPKMHA